MRVKYIVVAGEGCPVCYLPCAKKYLTDRSLHGKWSTILSVKLQENLGVSSIFFFSFQFLEKAQTCRLSLFLVE